MVGLALLLLLLLARDRFAVLPEFGFDVGYQLTSRWRSFIGYNFLYISDVARPGNQIDGGVNLFRTSLAQQANPPIAGPVMVAT